MSTTTKSVEEVKNWLAKDPQGHMIFHISQQVLGELDQIDPSGVIAAFAPISLCDDDSVTSVPQRGMHDCGEQWHLSC
jgi:hypothetical protein